MAKVTRGSHIESQYDHPTKHYPDDFKRIAVGMAGTMSPLQRSHFLGAKLAVATRDLREQATGPVCSMLDRRTRTLKQGRLLSSMRHPLLPRLLRGHIVPSAGEVVVPEVR